MAAGSDFTFDNQTSFPLVYVFSERPYDPARTSPAEKHVLGVKSNKKYLLGSKIWYFTCGRQKTNGTYDIYFKNQVVNKGLKVTLSDAMLSKVIENQKVW